jgi:hypothetical protein
MPWTIPNLLLHDKPVPLSNMRSHGRTRVFVYFCSNPGCHHIAEVDASGFPDDVTFGDLHRMLCTVCNHRGADVSSRGTNDGVGGSAFWRRVLA